MAPPFPIRPPKLAALALAPYFRSTAINNKTLKTCRYRHCEERSNLVNAQVITLRQIASFLAMTALYFLYDAQTGLRVMPALLSLLLLFTLPAVAEPGDMDMTVPSTVKTESDCDKAAILDLRVVYEDESLAGLVAPPAGVYPFEPGDGVVLRAYGMGDIPVSITWSGDASGTGETLYVDMDECKHITVTFSRALQWPEKEAAPWFDVTENKNFYAFLGGGDLYGWFAASRNDKKGAGITHITHRDAFLIPVMPAISLNFEHIFSGVASDNCRATFTPRTDPMKFCIESPGTARVQWPAAGSSWDMESEMIYRFDGNNAIDVTFSAIPPDDTFSLGYAGFMWATYQSRFVDHAIYFPGISKGVEDWMRFGPEMSETLSGRTVSCFDVKPLPVESGAEELNARALEDIFFTTPVYYGLLDVSPPESSQTDQMAFVMMFDQEKPIRFAVWNWCNPTAISAWDWQFIVHNPRPGKQYGYNARMVCTKSDVPDKVMSLYQAWRALPALGAGAAPPLPAYPYLPLYWSPAIHEFAPLEMGLCLERASPDKALDLYRELLATTHYGSRAARQMASLLNREYDAERRNKEQIFTCDYWNTQVLPLSRLGMAYFDIGDCEAAEFVLVKALGIAPDNANSRFYLGAARLWLDKEDDGITLIEEAVAQEPMKKKDAAVVFATRAASAMKAGNYGLAEILYRKAMTLAPEDHFHKVYLGEALVKLGKDGEALALYKAVLLVAPESPYTAKLVDNLYQSRNKDEACIRFWQDIYEQQDSAIVPALHLVRAYYEGEDYERTVAVADGMIDLDDPEILLYRCGSLLFLDRLEEGITALFALAKAEPDYASPAGDAFAARAEKAYDSEDFPLAERLYRNAVTVASDDLRHTTRLAETLEKLSRNEDAVALYTQVLVATQGLPRIATLLDALLMRAFSAERRTDVWTAIQQKCPEATLPILYLSKAHYDSGEYEISEAVLDKALEAAPGNAAMQFYLGASRLWLDKVDAGIAFIEEAVAADPMLLEQAATVVSARAATAMETGNYALAGKLYRKAAVLVPNNTWYAVHLGEVLEKQGRDEDALSLFKAAIHAEPEDAYIASLIHTFFVSRKDAVGCIEMWQIIADVHPDAVSPKLYLVRACYEGGNYERAVAVTEGMADQDDPEILLYRCSALLFLDRLEEGVAMLLALAKAEPDYASPAGDAFAARAEKAYDSEDFPLAERLYRSAITVAPGDLWHTTRLAETLERLDRNEEAVALYTHVLVAAQDSPQTAALLDTLLTRAFSAERRTSVWTAIQRKCPDGALPRLYLGKTQEFSGDTASALASYQEAVQIDPALADAQNGIARLTATDAPEGQ